MRFASMPMVLFLGAMSCLLPGASLLGHQAYLWAKGEVARSRIETALDAYLADGTLRRPWPWADFHPIARLTVPRLGQSRSVIEGASGTSLAFAVGHIDGTARPGESGNVVLAGHRDGAFRMLSDLRPGDVLQMETHAGSTRYLIEATHIVRADDTRWIEPTAGDRLTVVTCYPFRSLGDSGLRWVAVAAPERGKGGVPGSASEAVASHRLE